MIKRYLATICSTIVLACCLGLFGCGSGDANTLIGEWRVQGSPSNVTVVYSGSEFKVVGNTFNYKIDTSNHTITYYAGDAEGVANYSFSDNGKKLTLEESDGLGGTKTTVFDKVSDNGNAEPSANGVTEDE